jgi:hypothetical protein
VIISTTAPVTFDHARIEHTGMGIVDSVTGVRLAIYDSTFVQSNPGVLITHRAVELGSPATFTFENNRLIDGDGVFVNGPMNGPISIRYNYATNIGRYPHPTSPNCCVQFVQFDHVVTYPIEIAWNKVVNTPGQSGVEDNINFYFSGGPDSSHRSDVHHNLIDGAYTPSLNDPQFTGGGINLGDAGSHNNLAHDNTVISTTNYGIGVSQADNHAVNNLLVNDGAEQVSSWGQAIVVFESVNGSDASNNRYNWSRSVTDPGPYPCYVSSYCSGGVQVATTEQQARDDWEAQRANSGIAIGPRTA